MRRCGVRNKGEEEEAKWMLLKCKHGGQQYDKRNV